MKHLYCIFTIVSLFTAITFAHSTVVEEIRDEIPTFNEEEVKARLLQMPLQVIQPHYTPAVRSYLLTYLLKQRDKAENILGRSILYFPLFEQRLQQWQLPDDLKYLAVVESALNPKALSRVGALGLWQFMPLTGKEYKLHVGKYVDERCDPEKSTVAALDYLNRQYKRFGDWALALAAYNSGAGRVSRAIKRARSKNFWKVQKYLPRETRNYVPAFIAAYYFMQYYDLHELAPRYPELDAQITQNVKVYNHLNFHTIAEVTGLPLDLIEFLNPSYTKGFIPANMNGHSLKLPRRVMPTMNDYLSLLRSDRDKNQTIDIQVQPVFFTRSPDYNEEDHYFQSIYIVQEGETLQELARFFNISAHQLKAWNGLKFNALAKGQELRLFHPREGVIIPAPSAATATKRPSHPALSPPKLRRQTAKPAPKINSVPLKTLEIPHKDSKISTATHLVSKKGKYVYYMIGKQETLLDIANKFPNVSVRDLMILNNFKDNQIPKVGDKIKVKKKRRK